MTPIDNYAISNDRIRLTLQGPSGSGKTTLACQFPGAYVIDVDVNLGGTLRFLRERKLPLPVGFDVLDRDDKGAPIPLKQRYERLNTLLLAAQTNPQVQTIVIDSATTLAEILVAEICRQQNKNDITDFKDGRQFWGFFAILGRHFMSALSSMRKHIVLVAHEKIMTTESGAVVYPIKLAWPGQVGQNLGVFFTNVWRCENQVIPKGLGENTYKFMLRTMPDGKYELKNTLGVPALFEFNWKTIEEKLK